MAPTSRITRSRWVAAAVLAAVTVVPAFPAQAQERHEGRRPEYRIEHRGGHPEYRREEHGDDVGALLIGGLLGAIVGATIVGANQPPPPVAYPEPPPPPPPGVIYYPGDYGYPPPPPGYPPPGYPPPGYPPPPGY